MGKDALILIAGFGLWPILSPLMLFSWTWCSDSSEEKDEGIEDWLDWNFFEAYFESLSQSILQWVLIIDGTYEADIFTIAAASISTLAFIRGAYLSTKSCFCPKHNNSFQKAY